MLNKYFFGFLLFANQVYSQNNSGLLIKVQRSDGLKDLSIYKISIKNQSDSPSCILHSVYINLNDSSVLPLAPFVKNKANEYYKMVYSVKDTLVELERTICIGEILLPHQTINYKVSMPKSDAQKELLFEYAFLSDFSYRSLHLEMQKSATWYDKYNVKNITVQMPK